MRNIGKYHENQRLTCAPRSFTTKITKRHEEERSQMAPTTKTGVLFEHHVAKFEPLALILQPSAFFPNPLQNVKEQAPEHLTHSTLPYMAGNASTNIQLFSAPTELAIFSRRGRPPPPRLPPPRGFGGTSWRGGQKAQSWRWRFWMQQVDKQQLALV